MTTFYKFMITKKITDESPVGDLARDMKADLTWPRTCKYIYDKNFLLNYLRRRGACSQALDAFEEAWDEYDKFRAIQINQGGTNMNNWIKVKDKRPEPETRVLVTVKEDAEIIGGYTCEPVVWTAYFYGADENLWYPHFILDGMIEPITDEVIAWMPMPEPFEEKEEQEG